MNTMESAISDAKIKIEERHYEMPKINFDQFGDQKDVVQEATKSFMKWLNMPFIHDKFGNDHDSRRKWRVMMRREFRLEWENFYKTISKNKFRSNCLCLLSLEIYRINKKLTKNNFFESSGYFKKISSLLGVLSCEDRVSERKVKIEEIESVVFDMLKQLSIFSMEHKNNE